MTNLNQNDNHVLMTMRVLEDRIANLEQRLAELEEKNSKRIISAGNSRVMLEEMKIAFLNSRPHERETPFDDKELVFWYGYLIRKTPSAEMLVNFGELAKRTKKIRELVQHYIEYAKNNKTCNDGEEETWARIRVKDYLEFLAVGVKIKDKDGIEKTPNFYQATSPWSLNSFGNKVGLWQKQQKFNSVDVPLE